MSGTSWPALNAGAKAKASEVELKFDWIEGDLEPMSGGTKTNAAYDLGTTSFKWRNIFYSGQLLSSNGTVTAPGISFNSRNSHGFYYGSTVDFKVATDGVFVASFCHGTGGGKMCVGQDVVPFCGLEVKQVTDDFAGGIAVRRSAALDIYAFYIDTSNVFHLGYANNASAGNANGDFTDRIAIDSAGKVTLTLADDMIATAMIQASVAIETLDITTALKWKSFNQLKVLQIVTGSTATTSTVTAGTFTDSNLTVSITPKINTSKILVFARGLSQQSVGASGYLTLARSGTNLFGANGCFAQAGNNIGEATFLIYDNPATTSAVTYTVQQRTDAGVSNLFPTSGFGTAPDAYIVAIEIAA